MTFRFFRKSFYHAKYLTLLTAMMPFKYFPFLGKFAKRHASQVVFRREPVKFFSLHGFEGVNFLFLTDLHVGGNVDGLASEIQHGIHELLKHGREETTFILHGGDFCSSNGKRDRLTREHFTNIVSTMFHDTGSYKHFGVIGNHDEDNVHFPQIRTWLEEAWHIHFFTEPRHTKKVFIGERNICFHGMHTLATHLHGMKKKERTMLLDQQIYTLNSMHNDLNIVLLHNPDGLEFLLKRLRETRQKIIPPTLFLAGHTHGSAFNVRFLRWMNCQICHTKFHRYKGWYYPEGRYADTGNWKMYVSTGVGNSPGFDLRVNARPEVVLFTL